MTWWKLIEEKVVVGREGPSLGRGVEESEEEEEEEAEGGWIGGWVVGW